MPIKEFRCSDCAHEHEDLVGVNVYEAPCPSCGANAQQVILTAPKIDWAAMGAQASASPEFINRFEKVHKDRKEKEQKTFQEHGDYGVAAGA